MNSFKKNCGISPTIFKMFKVRFHLTFGVYHLNCLDKRLKKKREKFSTTWTSRSLSPHLPVCRIYRCCQGEPCLASFRRHITHYQPRRSDGQMDFFNETGFKKGSLSREFERFKRFQKYRGLFPIGSMGLVYGCFQK